MKKIIACLILTLGLASAGFSQTGCFPNQVNPRIWPWPAQRPVVVCPGYVVPNANPCFYQWRWVPATDIFGRIMYDQWGQVIMRQVRVLVCPPYY